MIRRAIALGLAWVMAITSMIWAAPPTAQFPAKTSSPTPYVPVEPPILALARAFEEMSAWTPPPVTSRPVARETPPQEPPPPPPALPQRVAAFAFGANEETTAPYVKVVQGGANFLYDAARGYGYTDVDGLDGSPNNRNVLSPADEIYDQLIGAKPPGADVVFRVDVPNGTYRFVAAGGDPQYTNHATTVRARNGHSGDVASLVEDFPNPNGEYWRVGFEGREPPPGAVAFAPLADSPTLVVTEGFVELRQIAAEVEGAGAGGDLNLLELWLVAEAAPVPEPPPDLLGAFAFGADAFTVDSPNAPGVLYEKVVQDGANFLYTEAQGFGYTDLSGLDTSLNDRGVLSGPDEIYDQFIGAKPAGARIVFRVDAPNGFYRLVAAGGDSKYTNHQTTIVARDGADGPTYPLVTALRNPENQFYRIGFEGKHPPTSPAVNFLPLSASPFIEVTKGHLEIHQIAGDGGGVGAGGDLSLLEIWSVDPEPLPEDFVAAFAFGADEFTRESPNVALPYTKVVQGGANFTYDPARGYGYSDLSGLDGSPNDRNRLEGPDEIYDQFIGAKPAGASIVFRVDVPPGEYRFVAAGGDVRYANHATTVRARDGGSGAVVTFVEDLLNLENEFFRVGFDDKHPPEAAAVHFLPKIDSPTLAVTSDHIAIVQTAGPSAGAGGDLSLLEIWRADTLALPPTVSVELPEDGGFFTSGEVPVRIAFENAASLRVLVDGVDRTSELTLGAGSAEGVLALDDGPHDVEAVAESASGAVATAAVMVSVDTEPPTIELDPVATHINKSPLSVTGTLGDRDPGASLDCPGASLVLESTSPDGLREWSFTCDVALDEGANVVDVTASDTGGRQAVASASVTLDTVAPQVTIVSPTPDTYSMSAAIDVSGGVFDDAPVTVRVDAVDASVSGTSFTASGVPLSAASNLLRVVATDAAGNIAEASVTVFLDVEPPVVTLTAPVEGAIVASPVTVTGTVADPAGVVLVNVNGQAVMTEGRTFTTTLTASDGDLRIEARAQDGAGNEAGASVDVTVDSQPPVIDITAPADGLVTHVAAITLDGTVTDATAVTLTLNGAPAGSGFPIETTLAEGPNPLTLVATDAAGNASSASVGVFLDTVAPSLQVLAPSDGDVLSELPVIVQGTVTDASTVTVSVNGQLADVTGNAWILVLDVLPQEESVVEIVATDAAGNSTTATRTVFLDVAPPVLSLTSPVAGLLTHAATVDVTGTVTDATAVSVVVNGTLVDVVADSFATTVALADGDNPIRVVATDASGRTSEASVVVTQDAMAPTTELTTPDAVSGITPGVAIALVTDNLAVDQVVLGIDGVSAETFTSPPYEIEIAVPEGVVPGDTLVVTVTATDTAGNTTSASRGVTVIEDGVVVGQVLDDTTSLPIEGATVTLGARSVVTGPDGRYSLPTGDAEVVLVAEKAGTTRVERRVSVLSDVGTVPVDARLTPIAGDVTPLSAQGLPALLPLGWSPLSAIQMSGSGPHTVSVAEGAYLARYRFSLHEWMMDSLAGPLDVDVTEPGVYAVVTPDATVAPPAPGDMLEGIASEILPASATASGVVDPPILPPSGGIASGTLSLFSPIPLPSGTVIQAEITERFALASGDVASEETRLEDIVLFQLPQFEPDATLSATFPIASSLTESQDFDLSDIVSGEVNLDLLAGRESVRGVRGGNRATSVDEGDFRLAVPSGALPEDTAIDLQTFEALSELVPQEPGLDPLAELVVDLSGRSLALGAELSLSAPGLSPDDSFILAKVTRIDGVPRMQFAAIAELSGERLVASGLRDEGRYVFFRIAGPVGFVTGTTTPPGAVVETSGLPFITFSSGTGNYTTVALTGTVDVTASIPRTSLRAVEPTDVTAGETSQVNLSLTGQLTTASVTPADGTLGVSVSTQVDVRSTTALDPATVTTDNIQLLAGGTTPVPIRFVLSGSGKSLAIVPESNLAYETSYTLASNALADVFGGAVTLPTTTFTTRARNALAVTPDAVSFSLPDESGIVQVTATGLPPGTTVLLVNTGNGIVASFTYVADGVLGELPASISDRILVTLTDPAGSNVSFEKSKFVAPDGTTAIGPGGGTVEGPGGVELRVPEGALPQGVKLKIESFDESLLPPEEHPELPGAAFGAGLRVSAEELTSFEKEVKLAFPKPPDAPEGSFFYVYRRAETDTGIVQWETIDHAFVEGDQVVTASFPFAGFAGILALTTIFVLVWSHDAGVPDRAGTGIVTGKVQRTVFQPGKAAPAYVALEGVQVHAVSGFGKENGTFALSQADGTYTLWDETFRDGPVRVRAEVDGIVQEATAYAINVEDDGPDQLRYYENVATANLTFPPVAPRPPPPAIDVVVFKRNAEDTRERTDGFVLDTDRLVIGFVTKDTVQQARVNDEVFFVRRDDTDDSVDWILDRDFVPGRPGVYTVEATAIAGDQSIFNAAVTFRAIAAGSSNDEILNDEPPAVITLKTVPKNGAGGVPVDIFPQVTFTEPVTHLPGSVRLTDSSGADVAFTLSGVLRGGVPIADISSAGAEVTAITLQPLTGLKFGERYTLSLSDAIEDLDTDVDGNPVPQPLVPFTSSFTTFGPEALGGTDEKFGSAGIAVLDDRAFLVENKFYEGILRVFDVEDPVSPREIPEARARVSGRPVDIAGANDTIVIATGPTNKSRPSNLYLFDVTNPLESRWVGAASVAASAQDGFVQRIDLLDGIAYVLTGRKGIHAVGLNQAADLFQTETGGDLLSAAALDVRRRLDTAGQGYGQQAVRQPIPLDKDGTREWFQQDLAVSRIQSEVWVGTTGEAPLILANMGTRTTTGSVPVEVRDQDDQLVGSLATGSTIALARFQDYELALVAGWGTVAGTQGWSLAVVDIGQPEAPSPIGLVSLPLSTSPTDILIVGQVAIVSSESAAALVNIANPAGPTVAGTISLLGGALAITNSGIFIAANRSAFGEESDSGTFQTALLGRTAVVERALPASIVVDLDNRSAEAFQIDYAVVPHQTDVDTIEVELISNSGVIVTLPASIANGRGTVTLPLGLDLSNPTTAARTVVDRGTPTEIVGPPRLLQTSPILASPNEALELPVDATELPVFFYSDSQLGRALESAESGSVVTESTLLFELVGQGGTLTEARASSATGSYSTRVVPDRGAGQTFRVAARLPGAGITAVTQEVTTIPGGAALLEINLERTLIPADAASEVAVTLTARDEYGNYVADGTPVSWDIVGTGRIEPPESTTTAGVARTTYRAGEVAGLVTLIARVDGTEISGEVELAALDIALSPGVAEVPANSADPVPVTITVTSTAGAPADSAELSVRSTLGEFQAPATLTDGQTLGAFTPIGAPGRARLMAAVAGSFNEAFIDIARPSGSFVSPDRLGFVGNRSVDGTVDVETLEGDIKQFSYHTSANLLISGTPGEVVDLELGGVLAPNVEPTAWYSMDEIENGAVLDDYNEHPGLASPTGVVVDRLQKSTGSGSLAFDGTGAVTVQDDITFAPAGGLGFAVEFRANEARSATLLAKSDAYGLSLVPDGGGVRLRAFVTTVNGHQAVLSGVVDLNAWHSVAVITDDGELIIDVDGDTTSAPIDPLIVAQPGPLLLGQGLVGHLDNVRVFDLSRPRLMAFENGADRISVTIGADGTSSVEVRSLGNLRNSSPNAWRVAVESEYRRATTVEEPSFLYLWSVELLISLFRLGDGFLKGEADSVEAFAGDIISGFLLYGDIRELIRSVYRIFKGTATVLDYFVLILSVVGIITTVQPVADVVVTSVRAGLRRLQQLPQAIQKLFGIAIVEVLGDFIRGSRQGLVRVARFLTALSKSGVMESLTRISKAIRSPRTVLLLLRLGKDADDTARIIRALANSLDALGPFRGPLDEFLKLRNVTDAIETMAHYGDEVARLGAQTADFSDEAITGMTRFMYEVVSTPTSRVAQNSLEKAKALVTTVLRGQSTRGWHPAVAEEFFRFVARGHELGLPDLGEMLKKTLTGENLFQGAYMELRLLVEAPELAAQAGRVLMTVGDTVARGGNRVVEGVDAVYEFAHTLAGLGLRVPQFWELKYVANLVDAIRAEQVAKHLVDKIAPLIRQAELAGLDDAALISVVQSIVSEVDLKFSIVLRQSGNLADLRAAQQAAVQMVNDIVATSSRGGMQVIRDVGFKFTLDDIIIRFGDPLVEQVDSLAKLLGP